MIRWRGWLSQDTKGKGKGQTWLVPVGFGIIGEAGVEFVDGRSKFFSFLA